MRHGHRFRRLGYDADSGSYHALGRHQNLVTSDGILTARIDGPLFFADADQFRTRMRELAEESGSPAAVIVDADAVHLTDTDGADILIQVAREFASGGTRVALAQVHPPTLALWRRAGLSDVVGDDLVFDGVPAAVDALRHRPAPPSSTNGEPRAAGIMPSGR